MCPYWIKSILKVLLNDNRNSILIVLCMYSVNLYAQIDLSNQLIIAKTFFKITDTTELKNWLGSNFKVEEDIQYLRGACTVDRTISRLRLHYVAQGIRFVFANSAEAGDGKTFLCYIDINQKFKGHLIERYYPRQSTIGKVLPNEKTYNWSQVEPMKMNRPKYALFVENAVLYPSNRKCLFTRKFKEDKESLDEHFFNKKIIRTRLVRPQIPHMLVQKYEKHARLTTGSFSHWNISEGYNYVFSFKEEIGDLETLKFAFEIPMDIDEIEVDGDNAKFWEEYPFYFYVHRKDETIQTGRLKGNYLKGKLENEVWFITLRIPRDTKNSFMPETLNLEFKILK